MHTQWIILLLVLLSILVLAGRIIYELAQSLRMILNYLFRNPINRYLIIRKIRPRFKQVLEHSFLYYQQLDERNKKLFEKRVKKFIDQKNFIAAGELNKVTPEMKVLVAASAVQLTFGLPGVYFKHFKEIHIHPEFYFSEGMQQYNAGEVHKSGLIMLSWQDFMEGYLNPTNARNVGLHEMAHALRLENMIKNEEFGYFDWDDIQLLNEYTVLESEKIRNDEHTIFRPYAAVHYHEFFAVLIEIFFEQPGQLHEYHPELFLVTTRLLKQNPLNPNERI